MTESTTPSEPGFRLRVQDEVFVPTFNSHGDLRCPRCGHDDISSWANDGEADLADWFDCQTYNGGCGANGAIVRLDDTGLTQNGLQARHYKVEWLQACEPSALAERDGITVTFDTKRDDMGFPRVTVHGPTPTAVIDYVADQFGLDDPEWFRDYVIARVTEGFGPPPPPAAELDEGAVDEAVAEAQREIRADVAAGRVPSDVSGFSALHDHVDANEYAGFCDDARRGDWSTDDMADVQEAVDRWIRRGGLQGEPEAPLSVLSLRRAAILPSEVADAEEDIVEDACQAAFRVIAERLGADGFPVTGDFGPDEVDQLHAAFRHFVRTMALNNPDIARMQGEEV